MADAAIVVLAGTESHADKGRIRNALETAREFAEAPGDEFELIFDGAGTQWVPLLEDEDHDYHDLYAAVRGEASVCDYCAGAFGVEDAVEQSGPPLVDENEGHPSIRSLVEEGYEIITF